MAKQAVKPQKLILGIGINDADYKTSPSVGGKQVVCYFYLTWKSLLQRCYSEKRQRVQTYYKGCTVAPEWHSFMAFRAWMENQDWEGNQLDKDVILPNNKIYSPEFCAFVSREVNTALVCRSSAKHGLPTGVSCSHGKYYAAHHSVRGVMRYLGSFDTLEEASKAYCDSKSLYIKKLAHKQTDPRIRDGLLRHAAIIAKGDL